MPNQLIVVDFDNTMIIPHTFRTLSRYIADLNLDPNSEQAQIASYDFIKQRLNDGSLSLLNPDKLSCLFRAAIYEGYPVSVASFTLFPGAIKAVLESIGLDSKDIAKVKVAAFLPSDDAQLEQGKNVHISNLIKDFNKNNVLIYSVVLIDDDEVNLQKLQQLTDKENIVTQSVLVPSDESRENGKYIQEAIELLDYKFKSRYDDLWKVKVATKNLAAIFPNIMWSLFIFDSTLSLAETCANEEYANNILQHITDIIPNIKDHVRVSPSRRGGFTIKINKDAIKVLSLLSPDEIKQIDFARVNIARNRLAVTFPDIQWTVYIPNRTLSLEPVCKDKASADIILKKITQELPDLSDRISVSESSRGGYTIRLDKGVIEHLISLKTEAGKIMPRPMF